MRSLIAANNGNLSLTHTTTYLSVPLNGGLFDEARRILPLDFESGLPYGYSLIQIGETDAAFTHIAEMKQRFGDRTKLRMLAKVADNALQASRANEVEAARL